VAGLFWTHGWHRGLSENLSSKKVFQVYRDVRKPSDPPLGIMGSMGNAPRYYAGGKTETITGRDQLLQQFAEPKRHFALVPASELCPIHAQRSDQGGYFVLDDSNPRWMLLSNQLGSARDKNPLATAMTRTPPAWLVNAGEKHMGTWEGQIELVGMRVPTRVVRGEKFTMTLVFKVLAPVSGGWKIFVHIDGGGSRIIGDHDPIRGRCATNFWKVGDYVIDTFEVEAGNASFPAQAYDIWVGFFTGSNPNWRNMQVTAAPDGMKDSNNRVKIGQLKLRTSRGGCCSTSGPGEARGAVVLALLVLAWLLRRPRTA
jgi:MYXO-CTERM domain-containing protein